MIRYLGLLIAIALAFWVYHDAKRRGKTPGKALAWAAGVLFLWIVFFPLWLLTRPKRVVGEVGERDFEHMAACPNCGGYVDRGASFCPHCGHRLS